EDEQVGAGLRGEADDSGVNAAWLDRDLGARHAAVRSDRGDDVGDLWAIAAGVDGDARHRLLGGAGVVARQNRVRLRRGMGRRRERKRIIAAQRMSRGAFIRGRRRWLGIEWRQISLDLAETELSVFLENEIVFVV